MKKIGKYKNGNTEVVIYNDGTKIRKTNDDFFRPEFAENCDVKITNKCNGGCKYCYEGCTPNGKHGDILNMELIWSLKPFTELAINGNDLSHPDLLEFLMILKSKNIIVNMTVNQIHFEEQIIFINQLIRNKLIYGLGVSLNHPTDEFISLIKQYENAVIHCINGILTHENWNKLSGHNLKLLILGFKRLKRGIDYDNDYSFQLKHNSRMLKDLLCTELKESKAFKVISFDNLALEQLEIQSLVDSKIWDLHYMGDDGDFTFYIDLVSNKYSKNSIAPKEERYELINDVVQMFAEVKQKQI